jgi:hypothetical protein
VIIATLIVAGVTAYFYGLRAGAWAGAGAFGLGLLAAMFPRYAWPIHLLMAAEVFVVCLLGPRRERPADSVRVTRWVVRTFRTVMALALGRSTPRKPGPDEN